MDVKEYKKYHERYLADNSGTSFAECVVLLSIIPFSVYISLWVTSYVREALRPVLEFFIVFVPVILSCTVLSFANYIIFLISFLLTSTILISKVDMKAVKKIINSTVKEKKTFITYYRAGTNFYSVLCILAVDFTIFPKRLAKTTSFGFGFMDLGVGFFVCSNGFVEKYTTTQKHLKVLKTVCALFVIGVIRLLSVKSLDYHEQVSEYGVHWNFFFTLATCNIVSYSILTITKYANQIWLTLAVGVIHQSLLLLGVQEWVFSETPRNSFFSANREGLASCLGYVCLYLASRNIGNFLFNNANIKKLLGNLLLISVLNWSGTFIFLQIFGISRKLVNLTYIFWILALSSSALILFILIEVCILATKRKVPEIPLSYLLESINANSLFFFICGNLLTGLINILFQTLLLGKVSSMIIIISYAAILCALSYYLYVKKIKLKL